MPRRSGPSIIFTGGANADFGSTAGTAGTVGGSAAHVVGSAVGNGGLAYFGIGVPVGQSGQSVQDGLPPITLSDVFSAGSVEGATHEKARAQLLGSVSGLSAGSIVNVTRTLGGEKEFDLADWTLLGSACQAGQLDAGLLDPAGRVQAMFQANGTAYVNAKNASGTMAWEKLNYSSMTPAVKEGSQPGFEAPEVTADRLESIAKAAQTQLGVSNFMGTDRAYKDSALPSVSGNGNLQFVKPSSYTGVTAPIPDSSYMIVGAKLIGQGVNSYANIGNNISLPSSLQASLSELVTKLNAKLDSLILDYSNLTPDQQQELIQKIPLLELKISNLISNPKDILEFISGFLVGYYYGNQYVSNYNNAGNSPPLNNLKLINVPPPENSNSIKASVENGYYLGYWVGYNITLK